VINKLNLINHPLIQHKLTFMRNEETSTDNFRRLLREISQLLAYEATRDLPTEMIKINTPLTAMLAPVKA
jgi:uracil phosphoribosyltransferase